MALCCPTSEFVVLFCRQLSLLSVNQYVGVCKPWRYSQLVTRRAVGGCLVVLWLVSSLQVAVPFAILIVLWSFDDSRHAKYLLYHVSRIEMQVTGDSIRNIMCRTVSAAYSLPCKLICVGTHKLKDLGNIQRYTPITVHQTALFQTRNI